MSTYSNRTHFYTHNLEILLQLCVSSSHISLLVMYYWLPNNNYTTKKIQNLFEVGLWGQNSQGSLSPYELLTIFPLNAIMQHNTKSLIGKPKACRPLDSNILNMILNSRCQVHLKPLKKTDSDAKIYYNLFSSIFSHSWPCFSHSAQLEDTPLKFLAPTLVVVLQHGFKVLQQKFPPS
jgi:hypothetical protein